MLADSRTCWLRSRCSSQAPAPCLFLLRGSPPSASCSPPPYARRPRALAARPRAIVNRVRVTAWTAFVGLVLAVVICSPPSSARSSPLCHHQPRARHRVDRHRRPHARHPARMPRSAPMGRVSSPTPLSPGLAPPLPTRLLCLGFMPPCPHQRVSHLRHLPGSQLRACHCRAFTGRVSSTACSPTALTLAPPPAPSAQTTAGYLASPVHAARCLAERCC